MPPNSEREEGDRFSNLEATIERLRAAATRPPPVEEKKSWRKKTAEPSSQENEFNAAVVETFNQLVGVLRDTAGIAEDQERRLAQLAEEMRELRLLAQKFDAVQRNAEGVGSELRGVTTNVRGLQERAAALEAELARLREEQNEKVSQLAGQLPAQQRDLRLEFQERIQHLLDEQRVCIRQLSLQASEEAVLADRARRAAELKLEELAGRVPPPAA